MGFTGSLTWAGLQVGLSKKNSGSDCNCPSENSERALDQSRTGNLEPTIQGTLHCEAAREICPHPWEERCQGVSIHASEPLDPSGADGPLKGLCPLEGKRTNKEDLPHPGVLDGDRKCTLSGIGLPFDLSSSFSFTHTVWWWTVVR